MKSQAKKIQARSSVKKHSLQRAAVQMFWFFLFGFALKCFTHCICCPHRCCRRSRWLRHIPSAWGCSGDWCTQTERRSKIHLEMDGEKKLRKNQNTSFRSFFLSFHLKKKKKEKKKTKCVCGWAASEPLRGGFACWRTAVSLVRTVLTVILVVARPAHGNATAAGTSKEGRRTLGFAAPLKRETKDDQLGENYNGSASVSASFLGAAVQETKNPHKMSKVHTFIF